MELLTYQDLKLYLTSVLNLSRDAFHIYIGLLCLILFVVFTRRGFGTFLALVPGLVLSTLLEGLDLRNDYSFFGYPRWSESLHDIVHTNLMPLLLVLAAKWVRRSAPPEDPR